MKAPDFTSIEDAGVHAWSGTVEPLKSAATQAHLKFAAADLTHAKDRAGLFAELDRSLALPDHFGHNWDALADSVEDGEWLGKHGCVIALTHAGGYRKAHTVDWTTFEDILAEASDYWRERHKPFWVFVS